MWRDLTYACVGVIGIFLGLGAFSGDSVWASGAVGGQQSQCDCSATQNVFCSTDWRCWSRKYVCVAQGVLTGLCGPPTLAQQVLGGIPVATCAAPYCGGAVPNLLCH